MLSESVPAAGWVGVAPTPVPFIREMRDAGQFYANRALRDSKDNMMIVEAWMQVLVRLGEYVKQHYTTGLTWNKNGETFTGTQELVNTSKVSSKKPEVKKSSKPVVYGSAKTAAVEKFELDGKKWLVEHFDNNNNIQIPDVKPNQSVSIYKCQNSVIKVSGKCNTIILNNCRKVAIVFDSLISSAEVINSTNIEIQVLGSVPTVTMDKSDSIQLYLSQQSEGCEVVTAKTSGINVILPHGEELKEHPVPEQFKTLVEGIKLITTPVEAF